MVEMTKRERVMAAVRGQSVDRIPVSFFGHNHCGVERQPDTLVPHLLVQNRRFDWDFMKIQSRATFYAEAWGNKYQWRWSSQKGPELQDYAVKSVDDFKKLERLDPMQGPFGEHVEVAQLLGEALSGSVPYVQTTLSPLAVATRLSGGLFGSPSETDRIKQFMRENPEALHQGLSVIAQTLADFARASIKAGADGMFLTTSAWATRDTLTDKEYEIFGKPYDLMIFEAAAQEGATFNILHICRENIIFDLLMDYPVQVINWEATSPRNPTLKEGLSRTDKAVWGGINHKTTLLEGPIEAIASEVHAALEQTGSRRFLLGPGCSFAAQVPEVHLQAAKEVIGS